MEKNKHRAAMRHQENNPEEELLNLDRHFNEKDSNLANNVLEVSDIIMNEVDSFNDPELSRAMRHTLCSFALA